MAGGGHDGNEEEDATGVHAVHVLTIVGWINVESPYTYSFAAKSGERPLSSAFGLADERATIGVRRAMTDLGVERSFEKAATAFKEHYGIECAATTLRKIVLEEGRRAREYVGELMDAASQVPASRQATTVLVEADGSMIPTVSYRPLTQAERTADPTRKRKREVQWMEMRSGLARDLDSASGYFFCDIAPLDDVAEGVSALAVRAGRGPNTTVVAVGDGGAGLKEAIGRKFPDSVFILDRMHLRGHLFEVAEALQIAPTSREVWVDSRDNQLGAGDQAIVRAELRSEQQRLDAQHLAILQMQDPSMRQQSEPQRQQLQKRSARIAAFDEYLERFKDSINYDAFVDLGWPIGSGEIESSHRQIPQPRLKIPGAAFLPKTARGIVALRVLRANGDWDAYWERRAA